MDEYPTRRSLSVLHFIKEAPVLIEQHEAVLVYPSVMERAPLPSPPLPCRSPNAMPRCQQSRLVIAILMICANIFFWHRRLHAHTLRAERRPAFDPKKMGFGPIDATFQKHIYRVRSSSILLILFLSFFFSFFLLLLTHSFISSTAAGLGP